MKNSFPKIIVTTLIILAGVQSTPALAYRIFSHPVAVCKEHSLATSMFLGASAPVIGKAIYANPTHIRQAIYTCPKQLRVVGSLIAAVFVARQNPGK